MVCEVNVIKVNGGKENVRWVYEKWNECDGK